MEISYTIPLRRAWQRMKAMLFHPFHIERWLVLGFAAFLAQLPHGGGSTGWQHNFAHDSHGAGTHALEQARHAVAAMLAQPAVMFAILGALFVAAIAVLVLMWVSARARLIYLDDVATGRAAFVEPWGRYKRLGTSLFLWHAAFSFTWLIPLGVLAWPFGPVVASLFTGAEPVLPAFDAMFFGILIAALIGALLLFVLELNCEFIEPLMIIHDESATRAWGRFWPLFTSRLGEFIAYGLFVLVLAVGVGIGLVVTGFATCCMGLVLLIIPYVNTVVTLPIGVTARALGPEFLAQFGPEWDLFAALAPKAQAPPEPSQPEGPLPGSPLPG